MTAPIIHRFPIVLREIEVSAISDLSPRLRRISFGGAQLGAFRAGGFDLPALESLGPSDHVKLLFPDPATGRLSLPEQGDGRLFWPENPPAISREYTPRRYQGGSGRLDLEFVLHGHGVAGLWAEQAQLGQRLHIAGPRASRLMPVAAEYLLIGDETALPAIANWLDALPADARVAAHIFAEGAARIDLVAPAGARIHWHAHDPADPAALLRVAMAAAPRTDGYLWAAGERGAITLLRDYVAERGLPPDNVHLSNYWTMAQ